MSAPLFVTRDDIILDELLRLAAAAGVTPEVAPDAATALRAWSGAPLVVIGADLARDVADIVPPRRDRVHVVVWGKVPHELFRTALSVGAEDVCDLPGSSTWLVETLTDLGDRAATPGLTIGVVGGSGGAGATTFACALGQVAARSGRALVIDTDPLGPGIDRVLGLESRAGIRWDELGQTSGRLSARSLREAVPSLDGLGVLTWNAGPHGSLQAPALREALSAAQRGHDTIVLDLPRLRDGLIDEMTARCDWVLAVAVPTVAGVASAARLCADFPAPSALGLVVRGRGVECKEIQRVTGVRVLSRMGDQRGLAESIDLGLGPVRSGRGPLARAAREVLATMTTREAAA